MRIIVCLLIALFCCCTSFDKEYDTHLKNGLQTYHNARDINLNFVPGLSLKKIAFIKKSNKDIMLVLRLNDGAKSNDVEKYSLAIKSYLDKEKYSKLLKGDDYVSTPIKPVLLNVNNYKYIVTSYTLNVKRIEKLEFFLFDRDKFRKVLGTPIFVKNIGI